MRSSLVGLQLLLACVLVWRTSVAEEKKECCGPGVPPEKSCCPKGNSTSQEPDKEEKEKVVPEEPTSEELEERGKEYRERMQKERSISMFLKQQVLDYFNKHKPSAFYRPIEDTDTTVKNAMGTIVTFTQFLGKTNCTLEEGRKFATPRYLLPWESPEPVPCVALPKKEQKRLKCRVSMFIEAMSGRSAMLWNDCDPVMFLDGSEDNFDLNHFMIR